MKIEYLHASKFGNGEIVAGYFRDRMAARDVAVRVHHVLEVKATSVPPADLYVFSSPGRFGKPIRRMRRFLKRITLPTGTRYAILRSSPSGSASGRS